VRALSVLPQELPVAIERMQAEGQHLRRTIGKLQEALALREASRLISGRAGPFGLDDHPGLSNATYVIVESLDGWDANGLKAIASAITANARAAVALFSTTLPFAVVIARSPDVGVDANVVLRTLIGRFGGRGGGKADIAQGGGLDGDPAQIRHAAQLLLSDPSATG
jgi:alanyl-tRNA synthetase